MKVSSSVWPRSLKVLFFTVLLWSVSITTPGTAKEIRKEQLLVNKPVETILDIFLCNNPCVITNNRGGLVVAFVAAAKYFLYTEKMVVVDGQCVSACAILADIARPNVCITERAEFMFHMAYAGQDDQGVEKRVEPPTSRDLYDWVWSRGGFPYDGLLTMDYQEARSYWPTCQ